MLKGGMRCNQVEVSEAIDLGLGRRTKEGTTGRLGHHTLNGVEVE